VGVAVPDSNPTYDVIVVGCGAMGSAIACHLARMGKTVLGLEQFGIPNDRGSSHGGTRIIRLAYAEDSDYVPPLQRSYAWWRELEREAGTRLLTITGSLDVGPEGSWLCAGAKDSCLAHNLPYALLSGREINRRFPAYRVDEAHTGVWQPDGGILEPERCVAEQIRQARLRGATILDHVTVSEWSSDGDRAFVNTSAGVFAGRHLVLAAGPWMPKLVDVLAPLLTVERQVMGWFESTDRISSRPDHFPVANLLDGEQRYATYPDVGGAGIKVMISGHRHQVCDADGVDRRIDATDLALLAAAARRCLAIAAPRPHHAATCLYTNTASGRFIVDRHPDHANVVIVSACSGHGFKFCGAIADAAGDLIAGGAQRWGGMHGGQTGNSGAEAASASSH
jgi:sarcosine oxidase